MWEMCLCRSEVEVDVDELILQQSNGARGEQSECVLCQYVTLCSESTSVNKRCYQEH